MWMDLVVTIPVVQVLVYFLAGGYDFNTATGLAEQYY